MLTPPSPFLLSGALRALRPMAMLVASLAAAPARAQPAPGDDPIYVDFTYQAPSECLGAAPAFSLVHRRSRRVRQGGEAAVRQTLDMLVVVDAPGYRGVLTVTRPGAIEERRSMTGANCDEVVEALALTAALSIDPNATLTLGPAETAKSPSEPSAEVGAPLPQSRGPRPTSPIQVTLGASFAGQRIMRHGFHLGGGVVFSVSRPNERILLPLEARASVHYLTEAPSHTEAGVFARFVLGRLAYCPLRVGDDISLLVCPVSQVGAVMADTRGFEGNRRVTRLVATVGIEGWLRARISHHWELWLSPDLTFPVTERRFAVQPGPEVLTSTVAVAWGVSSGIGWAF